MARKSKVLVDVLVRIDCPHCQGEIVVVARELEAADAHVCCEGCGGALQLGDDAAPAHGVQKHAA